jgi:hypothetical protein
MKLSNEMLKIYFSILENKEFENWEFEKGLFIPFKIILDNLVYSGYSNVQYKKLKKDFIEIYKTYGLNVEKTY